MTKTLNYITISGWLPVSYTIYKDFEKQINTSDFYHMSKFIADKINDTPKITNKKLIKYLILGVYYDELKLNDVDYSYLINTYINFIRDSYVIYNTVIKEEQNFLDKYPNLVI
jgi:hypothetical protein